MRLRVILGLLGCFLAVPLVVTSQTSSPGTLESLLAEVRVLRQTLERQAALQARAQLVMGRLTLQDQRLARARAELERAETDVQSLSLQRADIAEGVAQLKEGAATLDAAHQLELERQLRTITVRFKERERALAEAEGRRSRFTDLVAAEEGRYEELERAFDDLDRELQRPGP